MEELILKLTQAINDFNKYLKNEYSSINKNFSGIGNSIGDYSIFTIVTPKLTDYKINKTFPRANYILVSIDNSKDVVYLSVNALTKDKLMFRDGSKFEGIFSDLYLTYDFSSSNPLPKVQIFIGYNSKYNPISTVKIADVDSNNPLPIVVTGDIASVQRFHNIGGNVNNSQQAITLPTNISGHNVKGFSSILISNLDNTNTLYFGQNVNSSNYQTVGVPINAGEKFSIDFKTLALGGYGFTLFSPDSVNYSICYLYTED